jgi:NAD(P)-dependent dehydrogenase (short-subunit alcohol dehydrogenase family)
MSTQDQDVSTPDRNPRGRVALITGASRGLGRAIALALARAGVRLALVGRDRAALDETAAQARHLGTEAELFEVDVRNEDQVRQLATDVITRFGAADILVNNAGINIRKTALEFTLAEWNSILETNLTGAATDASST